MQSILVTGATGTLGRKFLRSCLIDDAPIAEWDRVIGFSRDEWKQSQLAEEFAGCGPLRLFLGDVRDSERLSMAMRGVDAVVHAAALKRIDSGSYQPSEMIATNVLGTMNVVNAAINAKVGRVVVISSDKATEPTNLYGMTKGCAESYAVHANTYGVPSGTRIAAVRYGNVLGSRGSVIQRWRAQMAAGEPVTLTSQDMTRFIMTIGDAVALVRFALARMRGGEVFIPTLPTARMVDLAQAVIATTAKMNAPVTPIEITGLRPGGEKLAESLLNSEELTRTRRLTSKYLVVAPGHHEWIKTFDSPGSLPLTTDESRQPYRSDRATSGALATKQLTVDDLVALLESEGL